MNPARVKMAAHVTMWVLGTSARALLVSKEARVKVRKDEAILLHVPLRENCVKYLLSDKRLVTYKLPINVSYLLQMNV